LAWWSDAAQVRAAGEGLGLGDLEGGHAWFEYPVSPHCPQCGGRGKSSFTDVLLDLERDVVAIEAKHHEEPYVTVAEWLGSPVRENRERVLQHWVRCCMGSSISTEHCSGLVYQMVHRTASACHVAARRGAAPHVVHLLFGSEHVGAYVKAVRSLSERLVPRQVRFAVVNVPTTKGSDHDDIAVDLSRRGPDALREALVAGSRLFNFGRPELVFTRG
jgi:rubredoxin